MINFGFQNEFISYFFTYAGIVIALGVFIWLALDHYDER